MTQNFWNSKFMKFHYGVISIMKLYIFSKIIKYIKFEETKKQLVEKKQ